MKTLLIYETIINLKVLDGTILQLNIKILTYQDTTWFSHQNSWITAWSGERTSNRACNKNRWVPTVMFFLHQCSVIKPSEILASQPCVSVWRVIAQRSIMGLVFHNIAVGQLQVPFDRISKSHHSLVKTGGDIIYHENAKEIDNSHFKLQSQ